MPHRAGYLCRATLQVIDDARADAVREHRDGADPGPCSRAGTAVWACPATGELVREIVAGT
jgi:hypothetical protein